MFVRVCACVYVCVRALCCFKRSDGFWQMDIFVCSVRMLCHTFERVGRNIEKLKVQYLVRIA